MGSSRTIASGCKLAILLLACGWLFFVLPGLLLGLGMAGDDSSQRSVPVEIGLIVVFGLLPPTAMIWGWRVANKYDPPPQP
jgi:hypothetical protein